MNNSATGLAIGQDSYTAQLAAGAAFLSAHSDFVTLPKATQDALTSALALQMAQIAGNAVITHAPGWDSVSYAPNTGLGLDRPIPALAQQVTGGGSFVALWLKTGTATTAWTSFGGGGTVTVPAQNVTPGLLQIGLGALTTVAGVMPVPIYNSNIVTVDGGGIMNGIETTGIVSSCILYLTFTAAVILKNGAAGLPSGAAPLLLYHVGTTAQDVKWTAPAGALSVTLQLLPVGAGSSLVWKLIGGPIS